jgi:hypothetical protein
MSDSTVYVGHPLVGVFMKCWRCQEIRGLAYDDNGGLCCPACRELLIPLKGPEFCVGSGEKAQIQGGWTINNPGS